MTALRPAEPALAETVRRADSLQVPLDGRLAFYAVEQRRLLPALDADADGLIARVRESGAGARVPAVGEKLPAFELSDSEGRRVHLASLLARGPLVISFNRGPWCKYCGLELQALARAYPYITGAGGDVVSIVPETQPQAQALQAQHKLPFSVLIDPGLVYAGSLGLVFRVGDESKRLYAEIGIDLGQFQGNDGWCLPIPATLVIARDESVVARFVDPDFRNRMNTEDVLAAVSAAVRWSD